jgi:hypothetical protein
MSSHEESAPAISTGLLPDILCSSDVVNSTSDVLLDDEILEIIAQLPTPPSPPPAPPPGCHPYRSGMRSAVWLMFDTVDPCGKATKAAVCRLCESARDPAKEQSPQVG